MANKFVCRVCKHRESKPNIKGKCTKLDKFVIRTQQGCQHFENKKIKEETL
jgi:hypothetical protein